MEDCVNYQNPSKEALLQRVEFTDTSRGDRFVFFHSHPQAQHGRLEHFLAENMPQLQMITRTAVNGQSVLVARTTKSPEMLVAELQGNSGMALELEKPKKEATKSDLIKTRGHLGIVSYLLIFGSAFFDSDGAAHGDNKKNYWKTRAGQNKLYSSTISLTGFALNSFYGVQKDMDSARLSYAKNAINQNIALRYSEFSANLPTTASTNYIKDDTAIKRPNWMERNSMRFSSAMKITSKMLLWAQPDFFKEKGQVEEKKDSSQATSAALAIAGDLVTLTGLPEDPFQLEKNQDVLSRLRRNSNFVSSLFDWGSTVSLIFGSLYKEKPKDEQTGRKRWWLVWDDENHTQRKTEHIQWWQLAASLTFMTNLIIKAVSPFSVRKLDTANLAGHTSLAIASAVKENHASEVAEITAQMMLMRELPEIHKQGFARTFTDIANRLESKHGVLLSPHAPQRQQEAPAVAPEAEITLAATTTRPTIATRIAAEERPELLSERIAQQSLAAEASLSRA